jgi:hypothetical protein
VANNEFSFVVHANAAFSIAKNWFFQDFLGEIRPLYTPPSHYVLSHSILDSEAAWVQLEEMAYMKDWKRLTLLIDGGHFEKKFVWICCSADWPVPIGSKFD